MMKKVFLVEISVGIILLIATYLIGEKALGFVALLAVKAFLYPKHKFKDEKFKIILRKCNHLTLQFLLGSVIIIFILSRYSIFPEFISKYWFHLALSFYLIIHGVVGYILFRSGKNE